MSLEVKFLLVISLEVPEFSKDDYPLNRSLLTSL